MSGIRRLILPFALLLSLAISFCTASATGDDPLLTTSDYQLTEPAPSELLEPYTPTDDGSDDAVLWIVFSISVVAGCLIAQGFNFWKW